MFFVLELDGPQRPPVEPLAELTVSFGLVELCSGDFEAEHVEISDDSRLYLVDAPILTCRQRGPLLLLLIQVRRLQRPHAIVVADDILAAAPDGGAGGPALRVDRVEGDVELRAAAS